MKVRPGILKSRRAMAPEPVQTSMDSALDAGDDAARAMDRGPALLPADDFDRDVWCVLGLPIDRVSLAAAAILVETAARQRRPLSFVTPNVNWLVRALREPVARRQIIDTDLSLADGAPVVWIARMLGVPLDGRAAGSDLFEALRQRPGFVGRRIRVFFFGGRPGSAKAAHHKVNAERGGVEGVGWLNPGYGDTDSMSVPAVLDEINRAEPDFVLVSLGGAKGQAWIERNRARLAAPVIAHLGAVVDFTAGAVARAPGWAARAGLEWAFRILADPALWRRYARDAAHLAALAATKIAPQIFLARAKGALASGAAVEPDGGGVRVRLAGDLTQNGLRPVRAAFREAVGARTDVTLDFSEVENVDRSFLGLVLMLERAVGRQGAALRVAGLNRGLRTLFRANAMNYAETRAAPAAIAVPGAARLGAR